MSVKGKINLDKKERDIYKNRSFGCSNLADR